MGPILVLKQGMIGADCLEKLNDSFRAPLNK